MRNRWIDAAEGPRTRVKEILDALGSLDTGDDWDQSAELDRLRRVLTAIDERFVGRRAELMAINTIQEVSNFLARAVEAAQQLANQVAGGTAPNIGPVNDAVDQAVRALAASPTPAAVPRAVLDAASAFDQETSATIARLQSQAQGLEADTEAMRADARQAVTDAQAAITAAQQQSDRNIEQNSQKLAELQGRVDTLVDNQQARFSETLEQQRGEFGGLVDEARTKMSDTLEQQRGEFGGLIDDARTKLLDELQASKDATATQQRESEERASIVLAALEDMRGKAEKQLTVIGATGLAGGYKSSANDENRARKWWRLATLGFGLLAVGFLIWAAAHAGSESASWIGVVTKSAVAVAFGSLAAYSGRLAGKHHRRAAHYRDRELALASLGTYLESLDEPARGSLVAQLAPSFFCELNEDHTKDDWPTQTNSLLEQASQLVTKLQSKA